jgi:hypothetical protein
MSRNRRVVASVGAALVLAGCTGTGLDPFPEPVHPGGSSSIGLDPFPEPVHPGGSSSIGFDPFPDPIHPGGSSSIGLDPFPDPIHPGGSSSIGLDPFPDPIHPGGSSSIGLDPFPEKREFKPWKPPADMRPVKEAPRTAPVPDAPRTPPLPKAAPTPRRPGVDPDAEPRRRGVDPDAEPRRTPQAAAYAPPARKPSGGGTAGVILDAAPASAPSASAASDASGARMLFKFREGDTQRYRMDMDMTMKMAMMGDQPMSMKMSMDTTQKCERVLPDGSGVLRSETEAVRMDMNIPMMGAFQLDSRDPDLESKLEENPVMAQIAGPLRALVGKGVTLTQAPDGEVSDVRGMEELQQAGGAFGGGLGTMASPRGGLPPDALRVGLEWPFEGSQDSQLGRMAMEGRCRVDEWDPGSGRAVVGIEGKIRLDAPDDVEENDMGAQMAATMTMKKGEFRGKSVYDQRRGILLSGEFRMDMVLENPAMGGEMTSDTKISMTLVE